VAAGRGAEWLGQGWALFRQAPLVWLLALIFMAGVQLLLSLVPLLGGLASQLVAPVLAAGLLAFSRGVAERGEAEFDALLAGFRERLGPLLLLGLLNIAFMVLIMLLAGGMLAAVTGTSILHLDVARNPDQLLQELAGAGLGLALVLLVTLALVLLVGAAMWYAPALVFLAGLQPMDALRESLRAGLHNWLPLLVFSLLAMVLMVVAVLPLGLGLLVAVPLLGAAYYPSVVDLFGQREAI
jgi:uncharacterized membrane protein